MSRGGRQGATIQPAAFLMAPTCPYRKMPNSRCVISSSSSLRVLERFRLLLTSPSVPFKLFASSSVSLDIPSVGVRMVGGPVEVDPRPSSPAQSSQLLPAEAISISRRPTTAQPRLLPTTKCPHPAPALRREDATKTPRESHRTRPMIRDCILTTDSRTPATAHTEPAPAGAMRCSSIPGFNHGSPAGRPIRVPGPHRCDRCFYNMIRKRIARFQIIAGSIFR